MGAPVAELVLSHIALCALGGQDPAGLGTISR